MTVANDAFFIADCLRERLSERNTDIFHRVVVIDVRITLAGDVQINKAMARDLIHHVLKERNTCIEFGLTRAISDAVAVPVIASGGVGELQHLADGVTQGGADAVLAASIFHFGQHTIPEAKAFMKAQGIEVRD